MTEAYHRCWVADECRYDPKCGVYPVCIRVDLPSTVPVASPEVVLSATDHLGVLDTATTAR